MSITSETMQKLELVTKINLSDAEREKTQEYFELHTKQFDMLDGIDTEGVEPLITTSTLVNVMREDIAVKTSSAEILTENAPERHNGYFVVPRILD